MNNSIKKYIEKNYMTPFELKFSDLERAANKYGNIWEALKTNELTLNQAKILEKIFDKDYKFWLDLSKTKCALKQKLSSINSLVSKKEKCSYCAKCGETTKFKGKIWLHKQCVDKFKLSMQKKFNEAKINVKATNKYRGLF